MHRRYRVTFHKADADPINIVVQLARHEIYDLKYQQIKRPDIAGPNGPIAKGYALRHATNAAPEGFIADVDSITPVALALQ